MSEYIKFVLSEKKPKTEVYIVMTHDNDYLGEIKWHGPWRQYCFYPYQGTIFNTGCMQYIIDFIKELMEARKK